jgi:SdpC family antimicrobial peptide
MRTRIVKGILSGMMAGLAVMTVAASAGVRAATAAPVPRLAFTGEEVFRGTLLGEGAVAERLDPRYVKPFADARAKLTARQLKIVSAINDSIVSWVRAEDPTFFLRYGTQMQSGNPVLVARAMDDARGMIKRIGAKAGAGQAPLSIDDNGKCTFVLGALAVFVVGVAVINVAAVVNADIFANAVTYANIATWVNEVAVDATLASTDGALLRFQFAAMAALRLASH